MHGHRCANKITILSFISLQKFKKSGSKKRRKRKYCLGFPVSHLWNKQTRNRFVLYFSMKTDWNLRGSWNQSINRCKKKKKKNPVEDLRAKSHLGRARMTPPGCPVRWVPSGCYAWRSPKIWTKGSEGSPSSSSTGRSRQSSQSWQNSTWSRSWAWSWPAGKWANEVQMVWFLEHKVQVMAAVALLGSWKEGGSADLFLLLVFCPASCVLQMSWCSLTALGMAFVCH